MIGKETLQVPHILLSAVAWLSFFVLAWLLIVGWVQVSWLNVTILLFFVVLATISGLWHIPDKS